MKIAMFVFAGMTNVADTVANLVFELFSVTVVAVEATFVSVRMPMEFSPPATVLGTSVSVPTGSG